MKAFSFRLEQARRWRETQVDVQKSTVAGATGRLAELTALLAARKAELSTAADCMRDYATGGALESYARFREKSAARIRDAEAQALVAQRTLTLETNRLLDASRKLRLLENLEHTAQRRWGREFDRELAAFADEAFLSGYNRKQGGRARSSGG